MNGAGSDCLNKSAPARQTEVANAMERLSVVTGSLSETVHQLEEKLSPILRPDSPDDKKRAEGAAESGFGTPLAVGIQAQKNMIDCTMVRMHRIISRIEV